MMLITNNQIDKLNEDQYNNFVEKSIRFLKYNFENWCIGKADSELQDFVVNSINLIKVFNIKFEINVQRYLFFRIEYKLEQPFDEEILKILKNNNIHESDKLTNVHESLFKRKQAKS